MAAGGDDLTLEVLIKALLDAKGFDQAQTSIKDFAGAANRAKAPLRDTGDEGKRLGDKFGGSRGPVADLTRVLLINIGASRGAGEAAKFAGVGLTAMEAGAAGATLPLVALTAAVALILPKLIDFFTASQDAGKAQKDFGDQIGVSLDQLRELILKAPGAAVELEHLGKALRGGEQITQADQLKQWAIRLKEIRAELGGGDMQRMLAASAGKDLKFFPTLATAVEHARDLRQEESELIAKAHALEQAMLDGTTVAGQYDRVMKGVTETEKKAGPATKDHAKAVEKLTDAQQAAIDQDLDAIEARQKLTERDDKRRRQAEDEEVQRILDRRALEEGQRQLESEIAAEKKINALNAVSYAGQALGAMSSLFGQNKALAIAAAIADTYAAANLALRTIPPPAGYAAAAASIAIGLANVQAIRKATPVGFDDPFSDLVARRLGRKSAEDFVKYFGGEFMNGMMGFGGQVQNVTHNRTTINRGTTNNWGGVHGLMANSPAQFLRGLERVNVKAERFRRRTTVGR